MGKIYKHYLDGSLQTRVYACKNCHNHGIVSHLSSSESTISKAFQGQHGKAYLMKNILNISEGTKEERRMTTGVHIVRDIFCIECNRVLGWKYEEAFEVSQRYKEGKYIMERQLVLEI